MSEHNKTTAANVVRLSVWLLPLIYLSFVSLGLPDAVLGGAWPSMRQSLALPAWMAGVLSFVSTACTVLSSLMAAHVIRRFGTGLVTAACTGMTALALIGYGLSQHFMMLVLLSIPLGILAGDQMLKTADVRLVSAQTVCAGKYIVVVSGEVAAVRSAVNAGVAAAEHGLVDSLIIPNVDERVIRAMSGACDIDSAQAVGVVETFSLACAIQVADAAVKTAAVEIIEVRLGRGLGGKSFVILTGEVAAVRAAIDAGEHAENTEGLVVSSVVIPSPHPDMVRALM